MSTITREALDAIAATLTRAGDHWPATAARFVKLGEITPGDDTHRDRIEVIPTVTTPGQPYAGQVTPGHRYHSTLYRDEDGQWWATGWSDASKGRVLRPAGWSYDEDAGVHVHADQVEEML